MKCQNCENIFNKASYAPRVLVCGHTLCHFCISAILNNGELVCVFCDYKHAANDVTDIPFNYSMLDGLKEEATPSIGDHCMIHKEVINGFCTKCKEFICTQCFKDLHKTNFGCVEAPLEQGFEALSTGAKVDHLSNLMELYSKKLTIGKTKVEEAKLVESAFRECIWSVMKDRHYLELYYENLEKNLVELATFKDSLSKCRSLNEFNDCNKKLGTLATVTLMADRTTALELPPSSANLWSNFPVIFYALRESLTKNSDIFVVLAEKEVSFRLVWKKSGAWMASPGPVADPSGSLSFEITPKLEKFVFKNLRQVSIVWSNQFRNSLEADIDIIADIPEDIAESFKQFCLNGKAKEEYVSHIHPNYIYIHKLGRATSIALKSLYNINKIRDFTATKVTCYDDGKYLLVSQQSLYSRTTDDSQHGPSSRGCPFLALVDTDKNVHFVLMKFPVTYISREFKIIGYCKHGVVGDFVGTNLTSWSTELRLF